MKKICESIIIYMKNSRIVEKKLIKIKLIKREVQEDLI
ncbi:hypothetical protein CLSA_c06870 [Clostridium saccharobutylicum DSM 13864]|uniref:Uncharacterized protein n=1 Tax=Clostridium saccharobutylicum DSM 13864 TaxID=1345695 RepID=U5MM73_CLOSA|nr:hypothetical protein CLSA_c06870 [Clostridium saccharobutylicum DSM 13864]